MMCIVHTQSSRTINMPTSLILFVLLKVDYTVSVTINSSVYSIGWYLRILWQLFAPKPPEVKSLSQNFESKYGGLAILSFTFTCSFVLPDFYSNWPT